MVINKRRLRRVKRKAAADTSPAESKQPIPPAAESAVVTADKRQAALLQRAIKTPAAVSSLPQHLELLQPLLHQH